MQNFAEKLGYLSAQESDFKQTLKTLIFEGYVKLQQSGYMSHSKMHPKLITILKDFEADPFKRKVTVIALRCPKCSSKRLLKKGTGLLLQKRRVKCYFCDDCGFSFYIE